MRLKNAFILSVLIISFHLKIYSSNNIYFPWQKGFLDIHHISTGRGNSSFFILPDGTTLLIDAGDISETHSRTISPRNCPDITGDTLSTGEYLTKYIKKMKPGIEKSGIDYSLITHYHDDHFGEVDSIRLESGNGYLLTGITEVGTFLSIHTLIDRGFDEPVDLFSQNFRDKNISDDYHIIQTLDNYQNYILYTKAFKGLNHQKIEIGSTNQIKLKYDPDAFPYFRVVNLFGNGRIWNGYSDTSFLAIQEGKYPGENPLSIGVKLSYGQFNYYTGGDIAGVNPLGHDDVMSMEAQAAPIVGMVDIATLNHHGNRDSQSSTWVRSLRPKVWIQQNWSSDHPGEEVLNRILSKSLYPEQRDLYSTCMTETTRNYIGEKIENSYTSTEGHIIVRIFPGGQHYQVIVLDTDLSVLRVMNSKDYIAR